MEETSVAKNENTQSQKESPQQGSVAERLIAKILRSEAILFCDQYRVAHIAYNGDGSAVAKLASDEFKQLLARWHWRDEKRPLPRDTDTKVIQTLTGHASFDGPSYPLSVRVAKNNEGLWYDLGAGQVVHITEQGWELTDKPPILFRTFTHQKAQVLPQPDGSIEQLRVYLNVQDDDDWLLIMAYLVSAFIPGFPHPLLALHGSKGAGKTTTLCMLKELVDPSELQGQAMPDRIPEFVQLASNHAFLFFDNLSSLSAKMSDALARAITGDSFRARQLYTDNNDIIYRIQLPIALNGINQVIVKPDLLDRALLVTLRGIEAGQRTTYQDVWEPFGQEKPQMLGAIFDILVKALAIRPTVQLSEMPRMADFTCWGCAIAEAAGYTQQQFLDAYQRNIARQNQEAIDASPVAKAVIALMKVQDQWEGTPSQLLTFFNIKALAMDFTSSPLWPKAPEWMTRRLIESQENLAFVGIRIEQSVTGEGRRITISKDPAFTVMPQDEPEQQGLLLDDQDDSKTVTTVKS